MAIMEYRTQDGLADYGFSIEFKPDIGWRVYIIFVPFRLNHKDSTDLPYQCTDRDGRRYVDWSSKLENLGDARSIAALWAELAQPYLRAQEQHALYVDLIQRCLRAKEQIEPASAGSYHRPEDMVGADGSGAAKQDRSPVIPHPSATVKSFHDHETEWSGHQTGEVA